MKYTEDYRLVKHVLIVTLVIVEQKNHRHSGAPEGPADPGWKSDLADVACAFAFLHALLWNTLGGGNPMP